MTRNLQLQFSPKSDSGQLENVKRSKQSKPSKHEGEMQSEHIQEEVHTPISPTHRLRGMLKNRRKKLELKKVYCKNVVWHKASDMFRKLSKRKPLFGYKLIKTLTIWHLLQCNLLELD